MLVTAAKTLVFANLCAVNSLPQMPCSMSQMRTVLSKLPVARCLLSELQPRHVTPSLPSQRVSYAVMDTDRPCATGDRALVVASARYASNGVFGQIPTPALPP